MLLIGSTSLWSFFLGRPGDFEAGLVGMVFGATVGLVVVLVEVIGRWLVRQRVRSTGEGSLSDYPEERAGTDS
jgi:hypothetical protein